MSKNATRYTRTPASDTAILKGQLALAHRTIEALQSDNKRLTRVAYLSDPCDEPGTPSDEATPSDTKILTDQINGLRRSLSVAIEEKQQLAARHRRLKDRAIKLAHLAKTAKAIIDTVDEDADVTAWTAQYEGCKESVDFLTAEPAFPLRAPGEPLAERPRQ